MTDPEKNAYILIRRKLASSRADIARMLGVSRPTASNIVQSLIDANLIAECGKGKSNGGTNPIALAVRKNHVFTVGIDLGYTDCMSAVLLDAAGSIIAEKEVTFSSSELYDLAELFKVFGDTTRIKILYVLFKSEMCVCDIAVALGMTQSAISHQLRILKQARLISCKREGKTVYYRLADAHVEAIIDQGMEHIKEEQ